MFTESLSNIPRKLGLRGSLLVVLSQFQYLSVTKVNTPLVHFNFWGVGGRGGVGRLFKAGRFFYLQGGRLFEVGAYSRLDA